MTKPKTIQTVGLVAKAHLERSGITLLKRITEFLEKRKIDLLYGKNAATHLNQKETAYEKLMKGADLAITLGGDGTLIKLSHHVSYKPVPVLAVNLGKIGLLTEVQNPENTLDALRHLLNNRYHLDIRTLLRATIYRKGKKVKSFLALNEIVINQGNFARLIDLEAKMNQRKMVRFRADGVIVATATGSTGHSLSAGGPIVHPKIDAFIFTPICPATLSMCPIVLPSNRQLTISIETERRFKDTTTALTIDGQQTVALQYGDHIKIRSSQRQLHLARLSNTRYYKVLRDRLNWGD